MQILSQLFNQLSVGSAPLGYHPGSTTSSSGYLDVQPLGIMPIDPPQPEPIIQPLGIMPIDPPRPEPLPPPPPPPQGLEKLLFMMMFLLMSLFGGGLFNQNRPSGPGGLY